MRMLVRSWNIFHGRTSPESGATDVESAVRVIGAGAPDVVCLQEIPVWALSQLGTWSGMTTVATVTMCPLGGPLARLLTGLDPRRLRSSLTGQANAVLVSVRLRIESEHVLDLNPRAVRREETRREPLPLDARREWRRNRRRGQFVRVTEGDVSVLIVNLHLTAHRDGRLAERELVRAVTHAEEVAAPGEPILVCGDLNLTPASSVVLREIERRGFSRPLPGIDQIVARGLAFVRGPEAWPEERRRIGGRLLSDHAPLEAEMIGA